jgi:hypothetical protein
LSDATSKLGRLKALRKYDGENAMHIFTGEIDVLLLRGDYDAVAVIR